MRYMGSLCARKTKGAESKAIRIWLAQISRVAKIFRHFCPQVFDFLVCFAQVCEQAKVVLGHRTAAEEPRTHAEELVEFHQLPVADENLVFAYEGLHQPLILLEHLGGEELLTI